MTTILKSNSELVVPPSVKRQAGIRAGDRLEFKVSPGKIVIETITAPAYKPTRSELAAIEKGEAAIARGEHVSLSDFLHGVDGPRRKTGAKRARKDSRERSR